MKRTLIVLWAALMAFGLLLTAGCGGGGTDTTEKTDKTETKTVETEAGDEFVDLNEDVATGIVGTFKDNMGRPGSIVFKKDGTFEGDAWGSPRKGTYKLEKTADDNNTLVLTFEDGSAPETWGVGIGMGKVAAVINMTEGNQYDKVVE